MSILITFSNSVVKAQLDPTIKSIDLGFEGAGNIINNEPKPYILTGSSAVAFVTYADSSQGIRTLRPTAPFQFPETDTTIFFDGGGDTDRRITATDGKGNSASWEPVAFAVRQPYGH